MNTALYNNIDWVGAVDWNIRDFHSYETNRGVTYNSYLIRDEKTALIDTVKAPFADELLKHVAAFCDLASRGLRRLQPRRTGPRRIAAAGAEGHAAGDAGLR